MIDQITIDRITDSANIVEVVSEFVKLKRAGTNFNGLCPFHNEKTPSFMVSPARGIYKCFGCGKGGNAVNFVMEHEHLSYYESLKFLARKYHIDVVEKEYTAEEIKQRNETESLLIISAFAQKFFSDALLTPEGKAVGMAYFKERGFREDIIQKFQLGYSPPQRDSFSHEAIIKGYKPEYLVKTGLSIAGQNNQFFDRFSDRVMFPIHNLMGRVIGFGGRILKSGEKTAKYLNSPESEIYHKSKILYGIFHAKRSIIQNDKCFLVEGYTDVLSMHQAGIENVVASSGTSLTVDQIRLIKRFTTNITILYDGDPAGIKASLRGIDLVLEEGLNVKVLLLPDGDDPDSFARKNNSSEFIAFIKKHETDFITFKAGLLLDEAKGDPIKKAAFLTDIVRSISVIPDTIARSVYIRECSKLTQFDEQILYNEVNKVRGKISEEHFRREKPAESVSLEAQLTKESALEEKSSLQEKEIIRILLSYGDRVAFMVQDDENLPPRDLHVAEYILEELSKDGLEVSFPVFRKIFLEFIEYLKDGQIPDTRYFINHPDPDISRLAADFFARSYELSRYWFKTDAYIPIEEDMLDQIVIKTVNLYKNQKIISLIMQELEKIKTSNNTEDLERIKHLQQRVIDLQEYKIKLFDKLGGRIMQ